MIDLLHRFIVPAAYTLLPPAMASDRATAMLLAIALQESSIEGVMHRTQIGGPARSFWMMERSGGIAGVLSHRASRGPIRQALNVLRYRDSGDECYRAVADNDVLAACFARCLLWTLPDALPRLDDPEWAWQQYVAAWRPGKPHRETWDTYYAQAWAIVGKAEWGGRSSSFGKSSRESLVSEGATVMYEPKWNHLRAQILDIAAKVQDEHPSDWQAVERKDNTFIRRVAHACQVAGLGMVGLNGKRGNVNDLSTDVLAFPNDTGCRDESGTYPGLELHDIINASDSPQKALAWGDSTQGTIDGGVGGAWVRPTPVGAATPGTPSTPTSATLPDRHEFEDEVAQLERFYEAPEGLQRPAPGLSLNGRPDVTAIAAWILEIYLRARFAGMSREQAREAYRAQIRESAEWKSKHQ